MNQREQRPPRLILEKSDHRCDRCQKLLIRVFCNRAAKNELALKTGTVPAENWACASMACGGLEFLQTLAPLQELLQ